MFIWIKVTAQEHITAQITSATPQEKEVYCPWPWEYKGGEGEGLGGASTRAAHECTATNDTLLLQVQFHALCYGCIQSYTVL